MHIKETLLENEALKEKQERNRKMINGLKLNNSKLTLERNELLEENLRLKRELNEIKSLSMFEFASRYCNDKELEEAGHAFARSLGVGH